MVNPSSSDNIDAEITISRFPTAISSLLYVASAVGVSVGPAYLFSSVFGLPLNPANLPILGVVTAVIVAGLVSSYGNVTFTCQLAMHKQQKQSADHSVAPLSVSEIAQASVAYSLFFNNAIYFVSFLLLSLGLSDDINIVIKFALAAILPLLINGYLTKPISK